MSISIAGLLSPPSDVHLELTNGLLTNLHHAYIILLSWEQPFTLNITTTTADNPITYRVYVSFINSSTNSEEVYSTSIAQFVYNFTTVNNTISDSICASGVVLPTFQVSAVNRVGHGERSDQLSLRDIVCLTGTCT